MKILHVVQGYTPAIGGTEHLIQKISENLVARYDDEVTVYTTNAYNCELFWRRDQPQLPIGVETINGVTVRRFPVLNRFNKVRRLLAGGSYKLRLPFNDWMRVFYNGPLIPQMTREIAAYGADIIAGSSFPLLHMHYVLWGAQRAKLPSVFLGGIHSADAFGFDRSMIYKAIEQVDAYIAYTEFERNYLIQEKGISAEKIVVVGVGVDLEPFIQANGRSIRQKFKWDESAPVVAYIGQQVPHKGVDMIMTAMLDIWQQWPEACLLIAGAKSTYTAVIEEWAQNLPPHIRSQVGLIHNFSESEKPAIFQAADMILYPSAHESFGIVFLEAWAARKPVIGINIGAIPSVVSDRHDGLLIAHRSATELATAIATLLNQPEFGHTLGDAGHQKVVNHYTWNIVTDKIRQVYQAVQMASDTSDKR